MGCILLIQGLDLLRYVSSPWRQHIHRFRWVGTAWKYNQEYSYVIPRDYWWVLQVHLRGFHKIITIQIWQILELAYLGLMISPVMLSYIFCWHYIWSANAYGVILWQHLWAVLTVVPYCATFVYYWMINPSPTTASFIRQSIGSVLIQIIACRLFGDTNAELLSNGPLETNFIEISIAI